MDTNKLIDTLGQDLKPVKQIRHPAVTAGLFVAFTAFATLGVAMCAGKLRIDVASKFQDMGFVAETATLAVAGVLSALAAFRLSIPDTRIRRPVIAAILIATAIWAVVCGSHCISLIMGGDAAHHDDIHGGFHCALDLAAFLVLPLITGIVMATRGAPVWTGYAGFCMALSAASIAAIAMRLVCGSDDSGHLLIWHFAPALIFSGAGIALGQFLSKRLPTKPPTQP